MSRPNTQGGGGVGTLLQGLKQKREHESLNIDVFERTIVWI